MKHANRIAFLVVVMILSAASQATAQSASDQARLEAYRWGVEFARDQVGEARSLVGEFRERLDNIEELLDESLEEAGRYLGGRVETQVVDSQMVLTSTSLVDAQRVVTESGLATSEAFLVVSEALLAAAEEGDETALQVAAEAYNAISDANTTVHEAFSDILEITYDCGYRQCHGGFNFSLSAGDLNFAWSSAALAALAAERAKAIVDILTEDVEEIPPELLEPLPTKFGSVA